eukprot:TRINITY_DN6418_c0_g2_i1.p4 TRINITY_DN6418_c0_g2~~TRINITY_DN6418_c0_g2_i1.p4  ORF type:complete len:151 (-),score=2.42 TRINITY_DN6418_c0_g2_i1:443-895(-)
MIFSQYYVGNFGQAIYINLTILDKTSLLILSLQYYFFFDFRYNILFQGRKVYLKYTIFFCSTKKLWFYLFCLGGFFLFCRLLHRELLQLLQFSNKIFPEEKIFVIILHQKQHLNDYNFGNIPKYFFSLGEKLCELVIFTLAVDWTQVGDS